MERRRVQLSGGTTYTVSLPKQWAEEHGIEPGTQLALYPDSDGTLRIEVADARDEWAGTMDAAGLTDRQLRTALRALYLVGYDRITVVLGESEEPRSLGELHGEIRDVTRTLTGTEVVDIGAESVTVGNLLDTEQVSLHDTADRLRLLTLELQRTAVRALGEGGKEHAEYVGDRRSEAGKLSALIHRQFNRAVADRVDAAEFGHDTRSLAEYHRLAVELEEVVGRAESVANVAATHGGLASAPVGLRERVETLAARTRESVDDASDLVLDDADAAGGVDPADGFALVDRCDDLCSRIDTLDRTLYRRDDLDEPAAWGRVLDALRRTTERSATIGEVAVQRAYRRGESPPPKPGHRQ